MNAKRVNTFSRMTATLAIVCTIASVILSPQSRAFLSESLDTFFQKEIKYIQGGSWEINGTLSEKVNSLIKDGWQVRYMGQDTCGSIYVEMER